MEKALVFFCFLHFSANVGFTQTEETVPQLFENIHLHLNKTTFIKGERLWFKAYVQDQNTQLPSLKTTNLHVAIYDKKGDEIKRKLFYTEDGLTNGDFAIDSTFTEEDYKIIAWTNYQRNFKHLTPFQQHIKIIQAGVEDDDIVDELKIEVYPEGGYLIEGAFNQIGIVLSRTTGERLSVNNLELVDGQGNVVRSNITTNSLGLGKIGFMVSIGKKYFLQWGNNAIGYSKKMLPIPKSNRIGLNIDNNGKDNILVKLIASKQIFKEKDGENYSVAIYQDESIVFEAVEIIEEESVIALLRKSLPYGVNTAVLFDDQLKPVSYRMFFNHRNDKERIVPLEVEHCLSEFGDSIQIDFIRPKNGILDTNVSVSVLPSSSFAYNPKNSIVSAFLVDYYLKNAFKGSYYFDNMNRKKRFELDKRLIVEGWGKYDWESRKVEELKLSFDMETGISISGKVLDADLTEENQVSLVTDFSGAYTFEELSVNKAFESNINLFEGDSLGISLIGKKGKLRKPNAEVQFFNTNPLRIQKDNWLNFENVILEKKDIGSSVEGNQSLNLVELTIALDEVVVTEKVTTTDNKFQITAEIEGSFVNDLDIKRTKSVVSYLRRLGFSILMREGRVRAVVNKFPFPEAPIIIEGMMASQGEVIGMPLSSVKFISFKKTRTNPFISIQLNHNYVSPQNRNKFLKFAIENGYARPQEYFTPNYPDHTTPVFKNYGAIDWKANILIGSEIPTTIMVPVKGQKTIKLFIEGMDASGNLFTRNETIITTKN
ncbi:hypothetical protein [Croceitalea rosinachiae]|uniref:MG2 domain-containing protein n=1 Tax=Croceitalea rosinachiae TaxID=3075596 RepID=A0ABU3A9G8_9FLAO|nr:hypothetical protein [Croceitalea sp. F388]MDT0606814.1 hypothetical protein [Croceitalea sp. F388]